MMKQQRDIKVVTDMFVQCENKQCKKWVRLSPVDPEDGMRTIPLLCFTNYKGKDEDFCLIVVSSDKLGCHQYTLPSHWVSIQNLFHY